MLSTGNMLKTATRRLLLQINKYEVRTFIKNIKIARDLFIPSFICFKIKTIPESRN